MIFDKSLFATGEITKEFVDKLNEFIPDENTDKFNDSYIIVYKQTFDGDKCGKGYVTKKDSNGKFNLAQEVYFDPKNLMGIQYCDKWSKKDVDFPNYVIKIENVYTKPEYVKIETVEDSNVESEIASDKFEKIDFTYYGATSLFNYLYEMNPNQFVNHLRKITIKMCVYRKIKEYCKDPNDPKEINRFYEAKREYEKIERELKDKRKKKEIEEIDYDAILKTASERYHLNPAHLFSVLQAKNSASNTANTKLKKRL